LLNLCPLPYQYNQCCQSLEKLEQNSRKSLAFLILSFGYVCLLPLQHHQCCQSLEKLENSSVLQSISKILEIFDYFSFFALLNLDPLPLEHIQ
jgi:hypothetical protein